MKMIDELRVGYKVGEVWVSIGGCNGMDGGVIKRIIDICNNVYWIIIDDSSD